jgi:hypothetical protein
VINAAIRTAQRAADRKIRKVTITWSSTHRCSQRYRELGTGVVISPIMVNDNIVDVDHSRSDSASATGGCITGHFIRPLYPETTPARLVLAKRCTGPPTALCLTNRASCDSRLMPAGGRKILFAYDVSLSIPVRRGRIYRSAPRGWMSALTRAGRPGLSSYTDANVIAEHVSAPMSEEVSHTQSQPEPSRQHDA